MQFGKIIIHVIFPYNVTMSKWDAIHRSFVAFMVKLALYYISV